MNTGDFSHRSVEEGPNWERAFRLAQFSSIPHLLFRKEWEQRRQRAEQLGPGKYQHSDFTEELARKPGSSRGVCQSRDARFPRENKVRGGGGGSREGCTLTAMCTVPQ